MISLNVQFRGEQQCYVLGQSLLSSWSALAQTSYPSLICVLPDRWKEAVGPHSGPNHDLFNEFVVEMLNKKE
jgi:hypothetical protein